jgi:rhodanese-related sulfurtransferase
MIRLFFCRLILQSASPDQLPQPLMTSICNTDVESPTLSRARHVGRAAGLPYAGDITPKQAWQLFCEGHAQLVDVRSAAERQFVGFVPCSIHVPWATGRPLTRNPNFLHELETSVGKDQTVLLLCRSGKRSALAAEAATLAGFHHAFNVLEGFEGDLNNQAQRGHVNGWRFHALPWQQD